MERIKEWEGMTVHFMNLFKNAVEISKRICEQRLKEGAYLH